MITVNFTFGSFEALETEVNSTGAQVPFQGEEELSSTWILVARVWALFIAFLGIPGNILTASSIIYQVFLNHRRQRLHSVSDSCFQQLKIIREGNLSESSEASSVCSFSQRKEETPKRKTTLCSHSLFNSKLLDKSKKERARVKRSPTPGKNSFTSFTSRESSPGIPLTSKYTAIVVESSNATRKESDQSTYDSHSRSPVRDFDEIYNDTKTENQNSDSPNEGTASSPHKHIELSSSVTNNNNIINDYIDHSPSATEESQHLEGRCPSTSSQTSRKQDFLLARKSLSIRSQSVSLQRNDCSTYSSKPSFARVGGDTILILHIILCDLLYCSINLPHTYYVYGFQSINGTTPILCKEAAFVRYVIAFAEWMTLGLLAIQRCIDLAKPPNARFFRMKSTISFILGIWVLSIILQLGNLINDNFGYNRVTKKCDCVVGHMTSLLYFYTLDSLLPCSLMMFGCFSIIFQVVSNKRRLQKFGMSREMVAVREREMWHSACLVLSLLLLFLFCVIPICIFNVLYIFEVTDNVGVGVAVYMIYWIQYGINFVVYVISKKRFRDGYKSLFYGVCHRFKFCCRTNHGDDFI